MWLVGFLAVFVVTGVAGDQTGSEAALRSAYTEFWDWRLQNNPEFASNIGDHRFDSLLEDYSPSYIDERKLKLEELNASVASIDASALTQASRTTYLVLKDMIEVWLDGYKWKDYGPMNPISFLDGIQTKFSSRAGLIKYLTEQDFSNFATRIRAYGDRVDQVISRMQIAVTSQTTLHNISMAKVPGQFDEILNFRNNVTACAFYEPFGTKLDDVVSDANKRATIRQNAVSAIEYFMGKLEKLKTFIVNDYMPNTRARPGVVDLPQGKEYYRACLRWHLSMVYEPEAIHRDGKREVEKVFKKMTEIARKQGHTGTTKEFFDDLRNRDEFILNDGDEIIQRMNTILNDRIRPALEPYFEDIPDFPMEIKKMTYDGPVGIYKNGAADGSRPGVFYANVFKPEYNPTYGMVALLLHETDPGHHLQDAYALTSSLIPDFMKSTDFSKYFAAPLHFPFFTAYSEGWALYCEDLGEELEIYQGDFEMLGKYNMEIFRAARMVVDTGLHYYGWSKEEAVQYMLNYTTSSRVSIEREIDRYATWPGQATSYTVGKLKIKQIRTKAEDALGDCFIIKGFHKKLVQYGGMPLSVMETVVDSWVSDVIDANAKNGTTCRKDTSHAPGLEPNLVTLALMLIYAFLRV